jgi:hypothetical protein
MLAGIFDGLFREAEAEAEAVEQYPKYGAHVPSYYNLPYKIVFGKEGK